MFENYSTFVESILFCRNEISLTEAEKKELMEILWDKEKAFMKDIIEVFPEPKPHDNYHWVTFAKKDAK